MVERRVEWCLYAGGGYFGRSEGGVGEDSWADEWMLEGGRIRVVERKSGGAKGRGTQRAFKVMREKSWAKLEGLCILYLS